MVGQQKNAYLSSFQKHNEDAAFEHDTETGRSTWVKSGAIQLTFDRRKCTSGENVRLEMVQGFMEGSMKSYGKGPGMKETERKECENQIKSVREFGQEVLDEDFEGDPYSVNDAYVVLDPKATHSPTKRGNKPNVRKSTYKGKQKSSSKSWTEQELKVSSTAKSEANEIRLTRAVKIASDHVKFIVTHGKKSYDVEICHTPSCSCPDNRPCLCKPHYLGVFVCLKCGRRQFIIT